MSCRRERADTEEAPRPVAEMPADLQIYDAADWLPPGVAEPVDGHDEASWEAFEDAHRRAYQGFLATRMEWRNTHELPPLRLAGLQPDDAYSPPANKVDAHALVGESNR